MLFRLCVVTSALAFMGSIALAQSDQETLRRGQQQLSEALKDPAKIKLMECMGVKVFKDPQPAGHPPSAAECHKVLQKQDEPNRKSKPENPALFYQSRYLLAGFLLRSAVVCGQDKKSIDAGFALLDPPELKMISRSYPETTRQWMESGAGNFNRGVMTDGVSVACSYASSVRQRAEEIAKSDN